MEVVAVLDALLVTAFVLGLYRVLGAPRLAQHRSCDVIGRLTAAQSDPGARLWRRGEAGRPRQALRPRDQHDIGLAAIAAVLVIIAVGAAVHLPLARVPENTLKFGWA